VNESQTELSVDDVKHVAALARLGLTEDETLLMREQLSSILGHIGELNELDTDAISPTAQVIALTNVWREDEVEPSLPRDQVLMNAPRQSEGCFEVDSPLGGDGSDAP
jgi:aspartyl-tRNA(Asn)/glutamyl-tRNA(Gln) amidotransferase subunit C